MSDSAKGLEDQLRAIVAEVAELEDAGQVTASADLRADLGVNSMRGLEIILLIEEELEIAVPEEALYEIKTFGDIVRFVTERVSDG